MAGAAALAAGGTGVDVAAIADVPFPEAWGISLATVAGFPFLEQMIPLLSIMASTKQISVVIHKYGLLSSGGAIFSFAAEFGQFWRRPKPRATGCDRLAAVGPGTRSNEAPYDPTPRQARSWLAYLIATRSAKNTICAVHPN